MLRAILGLACLLGVSLPALANDFCSGCGCKGGPGYRGPSGCVGWAQLNNICGTPPTTRCAAEGPALLALGAAAAKAGLATASTVPGVKPAAIRKAGDDDVPVTVNTLVTKSAGLACNNEVATQKIHVCPVQTPALDCVSEKRTLVTGGSCVEIAANARVTVVASSRVFDLLRIKIDGRAGEFWVQRGLVLAR